VRKALLGLAVVMMPVAASAMISVSPSMISFYNVPVNGIGQQQTLWVNNMGPNPVQLNVFNGCSFDFRITNMCMLTLNPGSGCTMEVYFTPHTPGYSSCTINVNSNMGDAQMISVSGQAVAN
jgi:hypothetical protein